MGAAVAAAEDDLSKMNLLVSQLRRELPFKSEELVLSNAHDKKIGLVVVDEVNGFCTVGCGNLAPPSPNAQVKAMVDETVRLAKEFSARQWPILALLDTHDPARPEDPYPPHCLRGSGEDELVPDLKWLEHDEHALLMRKDCINGFVGAMQPDGSNIVVDWVKGNQIQQMLVVGICTDVCVLDFVGTVISAKNHGLLPLLEQVLVYSEACATYDLSGAHPQDATHHMGLYFAAARGATIIDKVNFKDAAKDIGVNGH